MAQQIKTALVVDDSRLARIALSKLLKNRGLEVEMAGTGTEGLQYLREHRPDVVFMDYMMPDMDGFDASRQVLADPACGKPPIVMYTSQDTDEDRARAREIGIFGFLSKPTSETALDEILRALSARQAAPTQTPPRPPAEPRPAPAAPVTRAEPPAARPHVDIEALRGIAGDVAERIAQRYLDQLRQEMADRIDRALGEANQAAEQQAAAAARAAVVDLAPEPLDTAALEERLRALAQTTAREAAAAAGRDAGSVAGAQAGSEAGAETARDLAPQLVEQAKRAAVGAIEAVDFSKQLKTVIDEELLPALRQDLMDGARDAAEDAVQTALDVRVPELEQRLESAAREAAAAQTQAAAGRLTVRAVAAGIVAGVLAGVAAALLF